MNEIPGTHEPVADNDTPWRTYPLIDNALESANPSVIVQAQQTLAALDIIRQKGSPRERERATQAHVAYRRALDLFHELTALRDGAQTKEATSRTRAAITL